MPKRKRKVASGLRRTVAKSSTAAAVEREHDADSDGISEDEDVEFIKQGLEDGRLAFLKDLVPYV